MQSGDGVPMDARDVVATFRAAWDAGDPARLALGDTASSDVWVGLFGAQLDGPNG